MTPHGPHNPADIDPADYPERALFVGTDPLAATVLAWFDRFDGMPNDLAETIDRAFLAGGHVLVMARTPDVLAAAGAAVSLIALPYLADPNEGDNRELVH